MLAKTDYPSIWLNFTKVFYFEINNTLIMYIQVFVDFGKVKYVRNISSNITYRPTF